MAISTYHTWEPIKDLPPDWPGLGDSRLKHLLEVWQEQKTQLGNMLLNEFMTRLKREWAIETGMIENLYKLDRGLTQTLIESGLENLDSWHESNIKEAGRTKALIRDQEEVVEGLFAFIKGDRPLSTSYIKEIHQTLTRNQETVESIDTLGRRQQIRLERGVWKKLPNNPTRPDGRLHEYCPPEHVAAEMDRLLAWHTEHEKIGVAPELEAAWLHHRFTQIHPFQDGNGRVARALATLVLIKAAYFPLIVSYDDRKEYLEALEAADGGDLKALLDFFSATEQKAFVSAMKISTSLLEKTTSIDTALDSIGQKLQSLQGPKTEEQRQVWAVAKNFKKIIERSFDSLAKQLAALFANSPLPLQATPKASSEHTRDAFKGHLLKQYGHEFSLQAENLAWNSLTIENGKTPFNIVIHFHPLAREFTGVLAISASWEYPGNKAHFLSDQPFIFTYKDGDQATSAKFETWLNENLALALTEWQALI